MSEEKSYRIAADGVEIGVRTESQLRTRWNAGHLGENTYFLDEAANDWRPVSSLLGPREAERALPPRPAPGISASAPAPAYVLAAKTAPYSTPILATIFNFLGVLALLGGVVLIVIGLAESHDTGRGAGAVAGVAVSVLTGGACMFQGILLLGAAQVIDYIGRIAFQTERAADLLAAGPR